MDTTQQILNFFGWWELVTCSFAFLGLLSIWYHLGKKKGDVGQVWLALSVFCWAISGAIDIYYSHVDYTPQNIISVNGWRSILSLLNSLFILLSLPWFKHKPAWLKPMIETKTWYIIIGLPFLFSLLPTVSRMITGSSESLVSELDVYFAVFTLIVLVFILWESFTKRGLYLLGYLSVIFVLVTLVAQLYKITDEVQTLLLISAIFKSLLIMIFFSLALSWVKDLAEVLKINASDIYLSLDKRKQSNGRYQNLISITGIPETDSKSFTITNTYYDLLQKFILAKKTSPTGGWLEIKPKSTSRNIDYPIKDYNEIKRLTISLLDGLYGKGLWDKERHELPFKEALFEFSKEKGRQIRIKLPIDHISSEV